MIIPVTENNEKIWAKMCVDLWPNDKIEEFLIARKNGEYDNEFLYFYDEEFIGFLSLSIKNDYVEGTSSRPVGYIEGIYVIPKYRKKGIAKNMVEFAKKWSKENNCKQIASDCLIDNNISRTFHNKIGFKEANTIIHFVMDA